MKKFENFVTFVFLASLGIWGVFAILFLWNAWMILDGGSVIHFWFVIKGLAIMTGVLLAQLIFPINRKTFMSM